MLFLFFACSSETLDSFAIPFKRYWLFFSFDLIIWVLKFYISALVLKSNIFTVFKNYLCKLALFKYVYSDAHSFCLWLWWLWLTLPNKSNSWRNPLKYNSNILDIQMFRIRKHAPFMIHWNRTNHELSCAQQRRIHLLIGKFILIYNCNLYLCIPIGRNKWNDYEG